MKTLELAFACGALTLSALAAQDSEALTARRLFYQDNSPEVVFKATTVAPKLPAAAKPKPPVTTTAATAPKPPAAQPSIQKIEEALRDASKTSLNGPAPVKPAAHLGVRYNILKYDQQTSKATEVPPDTIFHKGDCAAIRMQPNRGGFLYVFNQGSSGSWKALIPSAEAPEETNIVRAYNLMDVPSAYCFEFDENPGTERLIIVVTDKPEDVMKLNDSLRNSPAPKTDEAPRRADSTMVASASELDKQVESLSKNLQGRDLKITRIDKPRAAGEAAYSTYLVNASASTTDRLVLEIKLKHEN